MLQKEYKWEDLTISQVDRLQKALTITDDIDKIATCLSIVADIDKYDVLQMSLDELSKNAQPVIDMLNTKMQPRFKNGKYTIDDTKYKLTVNVSSMTTAQFIDYSSILAKDPTNISGLISVFLIPKGHKYNEGYDMLEFRKHLYDEFKFCDAQGISFFFSKMLEAYKDAFLHSLDMRINKSKKKLMKLMNKEKNPQKMKAIQESIQAMEALQRNGIG